MDYEVTRTPSTDGQGFCETATIVHEGHRFTSGGACWHPDHGGVLYMGTKDGHPQVMTWGGQVMGTAQSSVFRNNMGGRTECVTAWVGGRRYHGRKSAGWSQAINLRPSRGGKR